MDLNFDSQEENIYSDNNFNDKTKNNKRNENYENENKNVEIPDQVNATVNTDFSDIISKDV